jgi:hypothetical protein
LFTVEPIWGFDQPDLDCGCCHAGPVRASLKLNYVSGLESDTTDHISDVDEVRAAGSQFDQEAEATRTETVDYTTLDCIHV